MPFMGEHTQARNWIGGSEQFEYVDIPKWKCPVGHCWSPLHFLEEKLLTSPNEVVWVMECEKNDHRFWVDQRFRHPSKWNRVL